MRHVQPIAAILLIATLPACFHELPPPPTKGYGEPYKGAGVPIYVKNGRNDYSIAEGGKPISSEKALEATKDEEYEIRRQDAKKYNDKIYSEGQSHRSLGKIFTYAGTGIAIAGFAVMGLVPTALREESTTPATAGAPEQRITEPGAASSAALVGGLLVGLFGVGMAVYGYLGGSKDPPYHAWSTPKDLDRPAYVREKTEAYNESIGAPPVEEQPGSVESVPLAPGQRKPPPERPAAPASHKAAGAGAIGPAGPGAPPANAAPPPGPAAKPGLAPPPGPSPKPGFGSPPPPPQPPPPAGLRPRPAGAR